MMAPAPKRLDAVEIHNTTDKAVKVSVVYDNHKDKKEDTETHEIAAGAKHVFKKELNMGSWTAVAPVKEVSVPGKKLNPSVNGVVSLMPIRVASDGAGLKLESH